MSDHERRITKLERDTEMHIGLTARQHTDHEQRIDAVERKLSADLWAGVAIGGYQQALTQVQEELRAVRADVEAMKGREVLGLDAEAKGILIGELNAVVREVDAIKEVLGTHAVGDANE